MTICEILSLRYQWEEIVQDYKLYDYNGTIDNLNEFVKSGVKGNRFRSNFDEALYIAKAIVDYHGSMELLGKKLAR